MPSDGYTTHIEQDEDSSFNRVMLRLMVYSGLWERSFNGYNLRHAVDDVMRDPIFQDKVDKS